VSNNAVMNQMFVDAASRGERLTAGALARLSGDSTADTGHAVRERLAGALNSLEAAERAGDEDAIHFAEFKVERAREAAQAARLAAVPEHPGFDGGVRQRRIFQPGAREPQSSAELLMASFAAHRVERLERDADPGQTIITNA